MFKKTADLIHLHDRAGSHATKADPSGRVDLRRLDETDFHSEENIFLRRRELRRLRKSLEDPRRIRRQLLSIMKTEDAATIALIAPAFDDVTRAIEVGKEKIAQIRATLPLSLRKVGDARMPTEWHRDKHREVNRQKRREKRKLRKELKKYVRALTKT